MTYTFAELAIGAAAYDEIAGKLREAGYDHVFIDGAIDMHGIGLVRQADDGGNEQLRDSEAEEVREVLTSGKPAP